MRVKYPSASSYLPSLLARFPSSLRADATLGWTFPNLRSLISSDCWSRPVASSKRFSKTSAREDRQIGRCICVVFAIRDLDDVEDFPVVPLGFEIVAEDVSNSAEVDQNIGDARVTVAVNFFV